LILTAFGALKDEEGTPGTKLRFAGEKQCCSDFTSGVEELIYMRSRHYDPLTGRFLQKDPIRAWGDPANFGNGYAYVGGDPVNRRDPSGMIDPAREEPRYPFEMLGYPIGVREEMARSWDPCDPAERAKLEQLIQELEEHCALAHGGALCEFLKKMRTLIRGCYRPGRGPKEGTSDTTFFFNIPLYVTLAADFFERPRCSQLRTLVQEAYRVGTGKATDDTNESSEFADAYTRPAMAAMACELGCCDIFPGFVGRPYGCCPRNLLRVFQEDHRRIFYHWVPFLQLQQRGQRPLNLEDLNPNGPSASTGPGATPPSLSQF
jgi:RHS repeat-associated protein